MFFFQIPWLPETLLGLGQLLGHRQRLPQRHHPEGRHHPRRRPHAPRRPPVGRAPSAPSLNYYRAIFRSEQSTASLPGRCPPLLLRRPRVPGPARAARDSPKISAPTMLIWGEQDVALRKELTYGMDPLFTSPPRVEYVPDSGHFVQQEKPELVNSLLLDFLSDLIARPATPPGAAGEPTPLQLAAPAAVNHRPPVSGLWPFVFGNDRPVEIEIGPGRGDVLLAFAAARPAVNFFAIEHVRGAVERLAVRLDAAGITNARVIAADAACVVRRPHPRPQRRRLPHLLPRPVAQTPPPAPPGHHARARRSTPPHAHARRHRQHRHRSRLALRHHGRDAHRGQLRRHGGGRPYAADDPLRTQVRRRRDVRRNVRRRLSDDRGYAGEPARISGSAGGSSPRSPQNSS